MYVNTSFEPPMFVFRSIALWPFRSTYPWEGKKSRSYISLININDISFIRDPLTDLGLPALGPNKDQLPQDLNVTFFFNYLKATVETIEIINTTNGERNINGVVLSTTLQDKICPSEFSR